jgi:hypothetical protein
MSISMFCGFDEMLEGIKETYDSVCSDNQRLRETLDNWNRDAEIQKAEKLAEHYRRHSLHHLSDREMKAIEEFRNQHYASCNNGSRYRLTRCLQPQCTRRCGTYVRISKAVCLDIPNQMKSLLS